MGSYTQGNDTYACDSVNCQISCASPEFGFNTCYSMKQNFLDGTPCGGGGKCSNGVCQGTSVGGQIISWIDSNKTLVIALCSGIGGLIVLAILGCCISSWRHRRARKRAPKRPPPGWAAPPPAMRYHGGGGWTHSIPKPPAMRSADRWDGYNGPPPVYMNAPTVRYA